MALNYYEINKIYNIIKNFQEKGTSCKILSLGYPDILVTKEQFQKILSPSIMNNITTRDDSIHIAVMHNVEELVNWCAEPYSFFESIGAELTVIDFTDWTGKEKVFDLNYPISEDEYNSYDIVLDPGTTEHVFNIAQAMINILRITKIDGIIYHQTPYNFPNHGFYNFSPTFYIDFYETNGAKLLSCNKLQSNCENKEIKLELREPFELSVGTNSVLIKKIEDANIISFPSQGKYKNSFNDKEALDNIKEILKDCKNIALVPYNAHSRFFKDFFKEKNISIYDDKELLKKHLSISPISEIPNNNSDMVLITSITFEKKIRDKLLSIGIDNEKILLQV